jgi:hypothetical protein
MNRIRWSLGSIVAFGLALLSAQASAAVVTWGTPTTIVGNSDVVAVGVTSLAF